MIRVVGLGAGGHSKVVIEILRLMGGFEIEGLLDPKQELWGASILGVPVLGDDCLLPQIIEKGVSHAFIGLGVPDDTGPRRRLFNLVQGNRATVVGAVHPNATISASAHIGLGPTVMAGAIVNAEARLGDNVIVNTGAIVEHECVLGDHVHVATGARLASAVTVGAGVHVGAGATVRQGVKIGDDAIVGAGAVVVRDVEPGIVVAGVPAELLRVR